MLFNVKQGLIRFLCALALGLILYDQIVDAAVCADPPGTATTCHSCSCGPHISSQEDSAQTFAILQPTQSVAYETPIYSLLLPQSIFHPPKASA